MSGAEGRRGEGISRRGELLASKGNETKSSALPHVAWNACLRAIGGGGGVFQVGETQELDSGQCR